MACHIESLHKKPLFRTGDIIVHKWAEEDTPTLLVCFIPDTEMWEGVSFEGKGVEVSKKSIHNSNLGSYTKWAGIITLFNGEHPIERILKSPLDNDAPKEGDSNDKGEGYIELEHKDARDLTILALILKSL